MTSTNQVVCK